MNVSVVISNGSDDCPCTMEDIEEYLDLEDFDRDPSTMEFVAKAKLPDRVYWIWEYVDSLKEKVFLIVTKLNQQDSYILTCGQPTREINGIQDLAMNLFENDL